MEGEKATKNLELNTIYIYISRQNHLQKNHKQIVEVIVKVADENTER